MGGQGVSLRPGQGVSQRPGQGAIVRLPRLRLVDGPGTGCARSATPTPNRGKAMPARPARLTPAQPGHHMRFSVESCVLAAHAHGGKILALQQERLSTEQELGEERAGIARGLFMACASTAASSTQRGIRRCHPIELDLMTRPLDTASNSKPHPERCLIQLDSSFNSTPHPFDSSSGSTPRSARFLIRLDSSSGSIPARYRLDTSSALIPHPARYRIRLEAGAVSISSAPSSKHTGCRPVVTPS